jgi:hypothetical protein
MVFSAGETLCFSDVMLHSPLKLPVRCAGLEVLKARRALIDVFAAHY